MDRHLLERQGFVDLARIVEPPLPQVAVLHVVDEFGPEHVRLIPAKVVEGYLCPAPVVVEDDEREIFDALIDRSVVVHDDQTIRLLVHLHELVVPVAEVHDDYVSIRDVWWTVPVMCGEKLVGSEQVPAKAVHARNPRCCEAVCAACVVNHQCLRVYVVSVHLQCPSVL